jgi:hypothetical protein
VEAKEAVVEDLVGQEAVVGDLVGQKSLFVLVFVLLV